MIDTRFYATRENGLSIADVCEHLGLEKPPGTYSEITVFQPASLSGSVKGDLCFLESKRHLSALESASATACFVTEALASKIADRNILPILCGSPKYEFARITDYLVTPIRSGPTRIAPTANVHSSAVIGPGVEIGDHTEVGPNVVITNALIGNHVVIGANTVIGGAGFGVASDGKGQIRSIPHVGRVVIGDRVRIGSNSCIDRGQLGDTSIGDDCQIDNLVQIAHNCILNDGCILAGRVGLSGSCVIGKGVQMGGSAGLADHVTIGEGARLAAFAGVMHDVPAGETWSGIPAMPIRDHMRMVAQAKRNMRK